MLDSLSKTVSIKGAIIDILSQRWPLSAKQIHSTVVKEFALDVTYQAVHKMLGRMLAEGLLREKGKLFYLDVDRLSSWKQHIERIESVYSGKSLDLIERMRDGETRTIHFDRYTELVLFSGQTVDQKKLLANGANKVFGSLRHLYWPLEFRFEDYNLLLSILGYVNTFCCLSGSDSPLDTWIKQQYEIAGTKKHWTVIGQERDTEDDIWTYGEFVFTVKYSPETRRAIDDFYASSHGLKDLFMQYFRGQSNPIKGEIELQVTRNKELAKLVGTGIKAQMEKATGVSI